MIKEQLYQVYVETQDGRVLAVGPKAGQAFLEKFITKINIAIAKGLEKTWKNPHLVAVPNIL